MNSLFKKSFVSALGVAIYIALVVMLISGAEGLFDDKQETILLPMAMLMLFVLSAAITGSLVLGKPILMYLDGQKMEAVRLFFYTLGWLAVFVVIVLGVFLLV